MACKIKGCPRELADPPDTVTVSNEGQNLVLEVCPFHKSVFRNLTAVNGEKTVGGIIIDPKEEFVSSVPTLFSLWAESQIVIGTEDVTIPIHASDEFPIHDGEFEIVDGKVKVLKAGRYQIDAFFRGAMENGGSFDVPGPAYHQVGISVNAGTKAPAWSYYPTAFLHASDPGVGPASAWSFPQDLEVDDVVEMVAKYVLLDTTDMGSWVYAPYYAQFSLTKIG